MLDSTVHENIRHAAAGSEHLLTASTLGVSHDAMARMHNEGVLERLIPGVYVGSDSQKHPLIDVAAWTLRYPSSVGCMLTAAVYHDLTDAFAQGTWLFVPKGTTVIRSRMFAVRPIQVVPWTIDPKADSENGILRMLVHGIDIRLTNPDRAVVDLWRYPHHVVAEHALEALRRRSRSADFRIPEFARLAQRLHVWSRMEPVMQGLVLR